MEHDPAAATDADLDGGGVGEGGVATPVPDPGQTHPAPAGSGDGIGQQRLLAGPVPNRAEGVETIDIPHPGGEHLAGHRGCAGHQGVAPPELEPVETQRVGHLVEHALLGDRRLGNPEPAERPRGRVVGVDGGSPRSICLIPIWSSGVDRHPVGHRRPPRGVGPGVEDGVDVDPDQLPVEGGSQPHRDPGGMTLGGRHHRLRPGVRHPHRATEPPGSQRQQRLHRKVELSAESSADGGGHDSDLRGIEGQDLGYLDQIEVRGLGGGVDLDAVAKPTGVTGFGLDVGVFDEPRRELALHHHRRSGESGLGVSLLDETPDQDVLPAIGVEEVGAFAHGLAGICEVVEHVPAHREPVGVEHLHRSGLPHHQGDRLAPKPGLALGQDRLIGHMGDHPEPIATRDVAGCEHGHDPRVRGEIPIDVANLEPGSGMRRPNGAGDQDIFGGDVVAELLGPPHLGRAVDPRDPGPDRLSLRSLDGFLVERRGGEHGGDDLAISSTPTQHPAEGVGHRPLVGAGIRGQQRRRRHQHARGADPTLGGAVVEERALQALDPTRSIEPLEGYDVVTVETADRHRAGVDHFPVEQHRTGSTIPRLATHLGGSQSEVVPQHIGQTPEWRRLQLDRLPVDRQGQPHGSSPRRARARRIRVTAASRR